MCSGRKLQSVGCLGEHQVLGEKTHPTKGKLSHGSYPCGPAAMGTNFPSVVVPLPPPSGQVGKAECLTRVRVRLKASKAEVGEQAELISPGLWLGVCATWLSWLP